MRHPAFDTNSDYQSRKNSSEQASNQDANSDRMMEAAQQEQQKKQEEQVKQTYGLSDKEVDTTKKATGADKKEQQQSSALSVAQQQAASTKSVTSPHTSAEVQKQFEKQQDALSAQMNSLSSAVDANSLVSGLNSTLEDLCKPISAALESFKKIPPKIRSLVDVEGAKQGMYSSLGDISDTFSKMNTTMTSSEVPITLDDYQVDPEKYPKLIEQQRQTNTLTEADCLSSGYTKIQWKSSLEITPEQIQNFMNPEEQSVVTKNIEKMFGSVIKTMWTTIQTPIQMIAGIANIGPIGSMIQAIIDAINGIVKIAETPIPEKQLDEMIRQQQMGEEALANESNFLEDAMNSMKESGAAALDKIKETANQGIDAAKKQANAIKQSISGAFDNMKMPSMPDGIMDSVKDMYDAVIMVMANIQNVFIVVLFKLMESVFKCFNQILGVIGVPTLPYPLNMIVQLIPQVIDIATFILGLPMSLMKEVEAIIKRKVKAMAVASMPPPPKPMPTVTNVPPTSKDVSNPDTTWENVEKALQTQWKFSEKDSKKIVSDLQDFFDGSAYQDDQPDPVQTGVVVSIDYVESAVKLGDVDQIPKIEYVEQSNMSPLEALDSWLPKNIQENLYGAGYMLDVPEKITTKLNIYRWGYDKKDTDKIVKIPISQADLSWEMEHFYSTEEKETTQES